MTLRSHYRALAPACITLALLARPAAAQAPDTTREAARAQYRKALEAADRNDWTEARRIYLELWAKAQSYDVASGLGLAEFKLGHHALGARYVARALDDMPLKEKPEARQRLQAMLAEMKQTVAAVRVSVSKDGAQIRADREPLGTSPLTKETYLEPGPHSVEAVLGTDRGSKSVDVIAGETSTIDLVLQPTGQPAPMAGAAPPKDLPAPPTASSNRARPNWAPTLVTGGLALVAVGVGIGFAVDASNANSDADKTLRQANPMFGGNPCEPTNGGSSSVCS